MIRIGHKQKLIIDSFEKHGAFLKDNDNDRVLMHGSEITEDLKIGDEIDVFVYCDSKDRPIATMKMPRMFFNQIDYLNVVGENNSGVFVDWGLPKDLFIPHKNMKNKIKIGDKCFVAAYFDDFSERIVGTTKVDFLLKPKQLNLEVGDEVKVVLYELIDVGFKCIVEKEHSGLLYKNEIFSDLKIGDEKTAYVKKLREDGKIDLSLKKQNFSAVEDYTEELYSKLKELGGDVPYSDKSSTDEIYKVFGVSKKMFKKACGILYKKKLIILDKQGIKVI